MGLERVEILSFESVAMDEWDSYFFKAYNNGKEKSVMIKLVENGLLEWGCDCEFAVTWRFSKENEEKGIKCKHAKECLKLLAFLGYYNEQETEGNSKEQTDSENTFF